MARRKRQQRTVDALETPTIAQIANGTYDRDFVTHAETNTKAIAYRSRESCIVERWCREGGPGFDIGAQRVIAHCQTLWGRVGSPCLTAAYGERIPGRNDSDGLAQHDALDTLHKYKTSLGHHLKHHWECFEYTVRHNEPAGVAGSRFAKSDAKRIQSAKIITGMVASLLASKFGY